MQQLPSGKWRIQFRIDGRMKSFTLPTKRDAEKKLEELRRSRDLIKAGMEAPKKQILFGDFAKHWMQRRARSGQLAIGTVTQDEIRLRRYLLGPLGHRPMAMITSQEIAAVLDMAQLAPWELDDTYPMNGKPLSNATRNRIRSLLNKLFQDAFMDGRIVTNPVLRVPALNERKTQRQKVPPLTTHESNKLLAAAAKYGPTEAFLVVCFLYSGARVSQIAGLQNGDFDVKHREITFSRIFEKASNDIQSRIKGRPEGIVMPMFDVVIDAFRKHLKHTKFKRPSEYCFCDDNGLPRSTDSISRVSIARYVAESKIRRVTPHVLRATFATQAEEAGYSKEDIQRMLGHSSVLVTERYTRRGAKPLVDKGEKLGFGKRGDDSEE